MSDSMQPNGLQPTRLLCPQDSPGKNVGVVCHFLLQTTQITAMLNFMIKKVYNIMKIKIDASQI